ARRGPRVLCSARLGPQAAPYPRRWPESRAQRRRSTEVGLPLPHRRCLGVVTRARPAGCLVDGPKCPSHRRTAVSSQTTSPLRSDHPAREVRGWVAAPAAVCGAVTAVGGLLPWIG